MLKDILMSNAGLRQSGVVPYIDFSGPISVYGLNTTNYILGWPTAYAAGGTPHYEYSLDNGSNWISAGTSNYAYVSGRTASTTDQVRVRANDGLATYSADLTLNVALPAIGSPTVVVTIIGSGGDVANPALWATNGPSIAGNLNLGTANKVLQGLMLNQEFVNTPCTIEGMTPTSTCYRELSVFPGCSFKDHVNRRRGNPMRYNPAVGAAMWYGSVTTNPTVDLREGYSRLSRLQIASRGNGTTTFGGWGVHTSSATLPCYMDDCIVESGGPQFVFSFNYGPHRIRNCYAISTRPIGASAMSYIAEDNFTDHINVIFVALGQRSPIATVARTLATRFRNCGLFGCDLLQDLSLNGGDSDGSPTWENCYTDAPQQRLKNGTLAALPAGVTQVAFDTSTGSGFTSLSYPTHDMSLLSTSALIGHGMTDSTNAPRDITGKLRSGNDVGPWQF